MMNDDNTKKSDEELVQRCLGGYYEAYATLVARYQGRVHGLAYHLTGDFEDARDLTQETFIKAFQRLSQLRDSAKFASWLHGIARHVCLEFIRSRQSTKIFSMEELWERLDAEGERGLIDQSPSVEEQLERREIRDAVLDAISKLPEKYRLPLTLYHFDELSYQSVADFMNLPLSTVKGRLHQAKKMLKEELVTMVEEVFDKEKLPEDFAEQVLEQVMIKTYGMSHDSQGGVLDLHTAVGGKHLSIHTRRPIVSAVGDGLPNIINTQEEGDEAWDRIRHFDLEKEILDRFGVKIDRIILRETEGDECCAEITFKRRKQVEVVRARPSDAISLARRMDAPAFATQEVLKHGEIVEERGKTRFPSEEPEPKRESSAEQLLSQLRDKALNDVTNRLDAPDPPRILFDGAARKAIIEGVKRAEAPIAEDLWDDVMARLTEMARKINEWGWQTYCGPFENIDYTFRVHVNQPWALWAFERRMHFHQHSVRDYKGMIEEGSTIQDGKTRRDRLTDAYSRWADYYRKMGNLSEARAKLQEGLRALGEDEELQKILAEVEAEIPRDEKGNPNEKKIQLDYFQGRYAEHCAALNPEVLSFEWQTPGGPLLITASQPIRYRNEHLGYLVTVRTEKIHLCPRGYAGHDKRWEDYEELTPASEEQCLEWDKNRRAKYIGSLPHFVVAHRSGRLVEEGFEILRPREGINIEQGKMIIEGKCLEVKYGPANDVGVLRLIDGWVHVHDLGEVGGNWRTEGYWLRRDSYGLGKEFLSKMAEEVEQGVK